MTAINYSYYKDKVKKILNRIEEAHDYKRGKGHKELGEDRELYEIAEGLYWACEQIKEQRDYIKDIQDKLENSNSIESMIKALELHFKCVVRPVTEYCQAFDDWLTKALPTAWEKYDSLSEKEKAWKGKPPLYDIRNMIPMPIRFLDIGKSSYLRRRIYEKDVHRTKECPQHKGNWSGCYPVRPEDWNKDDPKECKCWDGFECSGWIPEK